VLGAPVGRPAHPVFKIKKPPSGGSFNSIIPARLSIIVKITPDLVPLFAGIYSVDGEEHAALQLFVGAK